eukprot:4055357-Amphidinium_carterae.2
MSKEAPRTPSAACNGAWGAKTACLFFPWLGSCSSHVLRGGTKRSSRLRDTRRSPEAVRAQGVMATPARPLGSMFWCNGSIRGCIRRQSLSQSQLLSVRSSGSPSAVDAVEHADECCLRACKGPRQCT